MKESGTLLSFFLFPVFPLFLQNPLPSILNLFFALYTPFIVFYYYIWQIMTSQRMYDRTFGETNRHIRENKGNPFNEFQVPQAVIKFKQGIGRLIRSKSDTGIITILDNRVITKYYGRKFLNSLPKTNIIVDSKENIIEIIWASRKYEN